MKKTWKRFVTSFKPKYTVIFTMYHVIPGLPVKRKATRHEFGTGAYDEARTLYEKVVRKTLEVKLAPSEIILIKGKKKILHGRHFGPVKELRQFKMSA